MKRVTLFAAAALAVLAGCGKPAQVADPVQVRGKATYASGTPVRDVVLTLQPVDSGMPAGLPVGTDGSFSGKVVPGKYAYYLSAQEARTPADRQKFAQALKAVPEKYRGADMSRTVKVSSGDLQVKFD
jgi:hypothetical protein